MTMLVIMGVGFAILACAWVLGTVCTGDDEEADDE